VNVSAGTEETLRIMNEGRSGYRIPVSKEGQDADHYYKLAAKCAVSGAIDGQIIHVPNQDVARLVAQEAIEQDKELIVRIG
jgi:hypothetical protein